MLDPIIHAPVRLRIMVHLNRYKKARFTTLVKTLEVSEGNLSLHLKKLERAGYINITKFYESNRPVTEISITPQGQQAFEEYKKVLMRWLLF